jgi:predicted DNA-binding protein YlxM (UPF0122 family)
MSLFAQLSSYSSLLQYIQIHYFTIYIHHDYVFQQVKNTRTEQGSIE